MPKPSFLVSFNAETTPPYHNEPCSFDHAECISDTPDSTEWHLPAHDARVIESRTRYEGLSAIRQTTTVRNVGQEPLTVDLLASTFCDSIGAGVAYGQHWYDRRFILHYCHMVWQGEAQWRHDFIEELGIYPTYNHGHQRTVIFRSVGSWSTARNYPLVILEDIATGETYYFELHASAGWYIEIGVRGYRDESALCVLVTNAYEDNNGWYVTLTPGDCYTTAPVVYGKVQGGFEAAVAELTAYKRLTTVAPFPMGQVPVCFNDYMNCLWAQPSRDRLMPLIEAASAAGCEIFVIDAGWFGKRGEWSIHNGDWQPCDELFGDGGLRGLVADIRAHGMLPGVWLEMETVDIRSDFAQAHPEALLTRHGYPIGKQQCFMDFRQSVVRDHLMQVFDHLYDMGVRYVKNDYNHTTGAVIDAPDGVSGALAADEHAAAFLAFIDNVIATHPGFMIESCNSGAMRCDHGSLSHFHLQSTSDQEFYDRYPSIAEGMVSLMPPERAGIWAYPYPVSIHLREEQLEVYPLVSEPVKAMIAAQADGWQTAFNMVSGMMGALYLSGRICYADERNAALIRDAIAIYKENRTTLSGSVPVWPQGLLRLSGGGHTSLGLRNAEEGKLLLAVWQINTDDTEAVLDLTPYLTDRAAVVRAYPNLDGFAYSLNDGYLAVTFPQGNCAAYFELTV